MYPDDAPLTFQGLIELVFTKLQVRYGASWLRQWEGVDMRMVKSDWEQELAGFARNPAPLLHALTILPERVPNVKQFRDLANQAPLPVAARLARPAANQAVVARSKAKLAGIKEAMAEGAAEAEGPITERARFRIRGMAAATDNIGLFFGEDIFIAIGSIVLMVGFLQQAGIIVEPLQLSVWAIPTAIAAFLVHGARLTLFDRTIERSGPGEAAAATSTSEAAQ